MPTEEAKEAFRAAYMVYQESSRALTAAQNDLMTAMSASSEIFKTSRPGAGSGGVEDWDGGKAHRFANVEDVLAEHHERVAHCFRRHAAALREVTNIATQIINDIGPAEYAARGIP